MNETPRWPILHILLGVPVILTVSATIGSAMDGWGTGKMAVLYGAAMATPAGMAYTFLVAMVERSYIMVFWAREKIKEQFREAQASAEARGKAQQDKEWRAWYGRMQDAQREGRPFSEPPPHPPENRNGH